MLHFYFIHVPNYSKTCLWEVIPNLCRYVFLLTSAFFDDASSIFWTVKRKNKVYCVGRYEKIKFVTSKSWIKISCPRIYFLICASVLSLPFIRLLIGFLKKCLLHIAQTSWVCCLQIIALKTAYFHSGVLVSHVFFSTHLYQLDPQHNHNAA